jgi:hypothetical protein
MRGVHVVIRGLLAGFADPRELQAVAQVFKAQLKNLVFKFCNFTGFDGLDFSALFATHMVVMGEVVPARV